MPSIEPISAAGADTSAAQNPALPSPRNPPPAANATPKAKDPPPAPAPEPASPTRLLIEDVGGHYMYTLVDRLSGRVIVQLPREKLSDLASHAQYDAGAVINTKA